MDMMELDPRVLDRTRIFTRSTKSIPVGRKVVDTKKVKGPDSELYTSIWPVVFLIRIFGLAPYEFHKDTLVPSSINSIYSYVCFIAYTYIIYTILFRFMGVEMEKPLLGHTETAKAAFNYFMAIFDIVTTLLSRGKFVRIWNIIQDYDETVKNLGYARNETKTCVWSWIISCVNILTWIAVNTFGMSAFAEPWLHNVAYMLIYVGTAVSVIKFSGLAMLLGQRFVHLNIIAKKSGPSATRWLLASPAVNIKDIEYLHNMLMMASENLNSLYSWSLLLWLGNLNIHIVSDFFFVVQRSILWSWNETQFKILFCMISWILAFLGQLVLLNYACHFTSNEANCMGYIMINWKRWLKNSGISRGRYESVEMSIHLLNRRLNFSAAGCFYVNLPLLKSIAALFTTYLVILLQFPE